MKIILGGTRGSFPVSGDDSRRYGGDTFSLLVEDVEGGQVLIDAGSGIRRLKDRLHPNGTVLFTHTHLDHLIGLPLLEELHPRQFVLPRGGLEAVLKRVFSPPVWPVLLSDTEYPSPTSPMELGRLQISWQPVAHPDGCVAYRVDEPATGASLVVATDTEWQAMSAAGQTAFVEFARGADLMVFDAQFRPAEYEAHKGWGHSTWEDAVDAARRCGVEQLWLMHHSPERTDAELDEMSAAVSAVFPGAIFPTVEQMMETLHE